MKRTLLCAALLLAAPAVQAQTAIGIGQSSSGSSSVANSASNSGVTINNPGQILQRTRQTGRIDTTANAYAPQLVASAVNTCLGSAGVGVGVTGFGFSGGSTYPDKACNLRMFSALLYQMGQKNAAAAILCYDASVYNAFAAVGIPCPIVPEGYRVVSQEPVYVAPAMPLGRPAAARRGVPVETDTYPVLIGETPQRASQAVIGPCYGGGERHCSY